MSWQAAVSAGILVAQFIYHRWIEDWLFPKPGFEAERLQRPTVTEGDPYPLVYGRCRVQRPLLAYVGAPAVFVTEDPAYAEGQIGELYPRPASYGVDMLWQIGIGFDGGQNKILAMYANDFKLRRIPGDGRVGLNELLGTGNHERNTRQCVMTGLATSESVGADGVVFMSGEVEFHSGSSTQQLTGDSSTAYAPTTLAGTRMGVRIDLLSDEPNGNALVPGYRGHMLLFMTKVPNGPLFFDNVDGFFLGSSPHIPNMNFEVQSWPRSGALIAHDAVDSGDGAIEANPIDVIFDLLTGRFGKLGIAAARIDTASFNAAAVTLSNEGHGISIAFEDGAPASEMLQEILKQIDGVIYENPATRKIHIKLIRGDYDPKTVPLITIDNCDSILDYAAGGFTGTINSVRVNFRDRQLNYRDNSATAHNMANAVGQDGQLREQQIDLPGVCTAQLAKQLATREVSYLSRPIAKCRAVVDRSFLSVFPGDVVALTWPECGIEGKLFRVAGVDRGTLDDNKIVLSLIQDQFYESRGIVVTTGQIPTFPVGDVIVG